MNGHLNVETINEETLPKYLDTHVLPDPGLVIRTSGEARISNFLLWQSAYSEYEFVDTLWPDFTKEIFSSLVNEFGTRERRFGGMCNEVSDWNDLRSRLISGLFCFL